MSRPDLVLEQKVLRTFKSIPQPSPRKLLLAVSGGCDSMVMAEVLWRWRGGLKLNLSVAHIHHGEAKSTKQTRFRNQARALVQQWSEERQLPFFTNEAAPTQLLKSEQEWRDWREVYFKRWRDGFDAVALAHHQDDLLETRLIRLIRGSGSQGLRAMSVNSNGRLRPLLEIAQKDIRAYAKWRKLRWLEDPSNQATDTLRNWLRREWLPSLEEKRPGALQTLAHSLENLAPDRSTSGSNPVPDWYLNQSSEHTPFVGLRRQDLVGCSVAEQREQVARYLMVLGVKNYARTHVYEILKRMQSTTRKQDENEFIMLGLKFKISPDYLRASRV